MVLAVFSRQSQGLPRSTLLLLLLLGVACGGRKEEFIGARSLDQCNESWPVCATFAGCLIGGQSYVTGRFPGDGRFIVQLAEPSTVTVSFFLENVSAAGDQLYLDFFEDHCRSRIRVAVEGREFVGESDRVGEFRRSAVLTGLGDHLIEFQSNAQLDYTVKVDVVPRRLEPPE